MTDYRIEPSQWGFSAIHPNGRAVAHSFDRDLLDDYVQNMSVHDRPDRLDLRPNKPDVGPRVVPTSVPSNSAEAPDLTKVTYSTRARSTGASTCAGRTATGWGVACTTHGTGRTASGSLDAETLVSRPQEWCASCADIAAGLSPKVPK